MIPLRQDAAAENAAAGTSLAVALGSAVLAGDCIVVGVWCDATQTVTSVTDTLGNTYVNRVTQGSTERVTGFTAHNAIGGAAPTVTANYSASTSNRKIWVGEYEGSDVLSTVVEGTASLNNASTATPRSNKVAPTHAQERCRFVAILTPNTSALATSPGSQHGVAFVEQHEFSEGSQAQDYFLEGRQATEGLWSVVPDDDSTCAVLAIRSLQSVLSAVKIGPVYPKLRPFPKVR